MNSLSVTYLDFACHLYEQILLGLQHLILLILLVRVCSMVVCLLVLPFIEYLILCNYGKQLVNVHLCRVTFHPIA